MPITYKPLWETMKRKKITKYTLRVKLKIGGGTLDNLRNDKYVSTHTIEALCDYMDCEVQDVMRRVHGKLT